MFYNGMHNQPMRMPEMRQDMRSGAFDPGGPLKGNGGIVPPHMRQGGGLPPMQLPQMHTGGPGQMFPMQGLSRPGGMQPSPSMGLRQAGGMQPFPQGFNWNALARMYFGGGR